MGEIDQEFDRNVSELWQKDRDELIRLRAENPRLVGELERYAGAGCTCSICNWTNVGCLNIGELEHPVYICHGCTKRIFDDLQHHKSALEKARVALDEALQTVDAYTPGVWRSGSKRAQWQEALTAINEVLK